MKGGRLSDYDFDLPESLIAQTPLEDRAASRLLVLRFPSGRIEHRAFREVPSLLRAGDVLVLNDTRVSARRLYGRKPSGARVEALLLHRLAPGLYDALIKPARRLPPGAEILFEARFPAVVELGADDPLRRLRFEGDPDLSAAGTVPLPPYIRERLETESRYDTVYAEALGSAAAPTAGLHFTPELLAKLEAEDVPNARVTLHVGLDTFRPVEAEELSDHRMHGEAAVVTAAAADRVNARRGRLVAVGTTTVRTLETFADENGRVEPGERRADLFIRPGYAFRAVDAMFTNFHLPKTTMLAMISAFAGYENIRRAYDEAIRGRYRFLSFGDSMLLLPDKISS